jgi:hypothetical protein
MRVSDCLPVPPTPVGERGGEGRREGEKVKEREKKEEEEEEEEEEDKHGRGLGLGHRQKHTQTQTHTDTDTHTHTHTHTHKRTDEEGIATRLADHACNARHVLDGVLEKDQLHFFGGPEVVVVKVLLQNLLNLKAKRREGKE